MNELLKIILSLSLSGALLILVLLLCKPLVKDKLSKRWQYYIWLIVVARFLLPFAPETNLMGMVFQHFDNAMNQTDTSPQQEQEPSALHETDLTDQLDVPGQIGMGNGEPLEPEKVTTPSMFEMVKQNVAVICLLVWLIVAACLLIRKVTVYQSFVKYINAGRIEISDMQLWERVGKLVEQTGIKGSVELYTNSLISSPLLIGFFRPCIMLPTTELSVSDFENTILHELMHYKRRDMFYKWLVQVTICLHWFNPLVYFMGREVGRACELSCDEAVIRSMDVRGQRAYGDTLLNAMGMGGSYKDSLASVTLNEGKELLKERLDAIMKFKKTTRLTAAISVALVFALCFGATAAGAYAAPFVAKSELPTSDTNTKVKDDSIGETSSSTPPAIQSGDNVTVSFSGVSVTGQGPVGVELVKSQNSNVTFELLNMDKENTCATDANIVNGIMQITVNNDVPNGIDVNFGPEYKNVVRVYIPDAVYTRFDIQTTEMVVQMQDFNAPVHVESNRAGFWLIDDIVSQGMYDIKVSSGPIYIEADTILNDISANALNGPLTVRFNKTPTNLYLDTTNCGPSVKRPDDWPAIYKIGNESPKIILSNTGNTVIAVKNKDNKNNSITEMETFNIGDKVYYLVVNETQLRSIGQGEYSLDKDYVQGADIQLSSNEWIPIGTVDKPFTGSFSGNGCEIIGLTMTDPNAKIIGLFGVAEGANIHNITLRDYDIQSAGRNVTGKSAAPILALALRGTRSYDNQVYPKEK